MNTKTHQNLQKGTKDLNSKNDPKHPTGKLMDKILNNMKSTKKSPRQPGGHSLPFYHQSKLEPEYLNNILIDLNDANKLKNKQHKITNLVKPSTDRRLVPAPQPLPPLNRRPVSPNSSSPTRNTAVDPVNSSVLSKTEKRPKSGIKRRLKKLIGYKDQSVEANEHKNQQSAHSTKRVKSTKKSTANVRPIKEDAAHNVHQISNHERSINNNTSNSIAENKVKKTKKDTKKIEFKEQKISYMALLSSEKKNIKNKQKSNPKKKITSNTSCPQTVLAKTSMQSQQSKKIKLLVNQIASNLKQTSCFELNTGSIKRDIYIKGLSSCMTSQALEQINKILNPPRTAANRVNTSTIKKNNNVLVKSNTQNTGIEDLQRPTTTPQLRNESKMSIANEINTFNKPQPQTLGNVSQLPVQNVLPESPKTIDHDGDKTKEVPQIAPDKNLPEKTVSIEDKASIYKTPTTPQEDELIKKINEKIDKIITTGLNEVDKIDTSTTSVVTRKISEENGAKRIELVKLPPPIDPVILKTSIARSKEPVRFMQAPITKHTNVSTIMSAKIIQNTTLINTSREPSQYKSASQIASELPKISNILTVVRNSEIVNNIKQNTIKVLQKAISKNAANNVQSATIQKTNTVIEKKATNENMPKATNSIGPDPINKTVPLLKPMELSTVNLQKSMNNIQNKIPYKFLQMNSDKMTVRKPSKQIDPNSTTSTVITTTNVCKIKTTINAPANRISSSSTLNLIAALSTSKKFSLLSPMEVVQDFVNLVNHAKKNRKTFTICGNFYSLRRAFAERGWVEKMRINIMDDRETWRKIENLSNFELVDGMRHKECGEKYRRVFLTKLLAGHQVDFYWDYLTNPFAVNNDKIKRTLINRFPYGATRAYTSKHGLTESLRDAHWYCIEGHANIYYPRTYNLSLIEETSSFVEDFRITAVISLLQWIVSNMATPEKIISASGDVPTSVYNFATIQCHNFIKIKEHRDIDEVIPQAKDYEWEVFLEKYYKIVHNDNSFKINERISAELMIEQSKYVLKKVKKYLPNLHLDGFKNMWLLKPNNGSRGCGIHVCRTLKYMMDTLNNRKDIKYVVQKYLERPLLIHKTKFDIRQWFLVTCMPNVKVWLYKECYLRFSSQMFDLNKLHESIHLTNNSVQCRYKNNNQRSTSLPEQNMWDSETFKKYLVEIGQPYAWRNNIYKGMKECLIALFMLCQSKMELRINSFELCGADFMLSEDYHPYLIEINSRPALYASTKITAKMCPKVLEDVIKVTVDHARNPKASTGDFELIYTDSFNYSIPRNVNNLYIEGMSYFSKFIDKKPSTGLNNISIVPIHAAKEVKNDSIKKILNIDPGVVKIDVRNTLEKILAVVHNDSNSKVKESPEERNKKFRSMLSEFVSIISNVKNVNEEV